MEEKQDEPLVPLQLKVPASLKRAVKNKSAETGISISFVVRKALEAWVKESEQKKEAA